MRYSKGVMWLDDCRIPFVDEKVPRLNVSYEHKTNNNFGGGNDNRHGTSTQSISQGQGRFTPNLLVCDDMLNDGIKPNKGHRSKSKVTGYGEFGGGKSEYHGIGEYMEVDSKSRYYDLDKWFDKIIDNL
jgi:hypothetical protein